MKRANMKNSAEIADEIMRELTRCDLPFSIEDSMVRTRIVPLFLRLRAAVEKEHGMLRETIMELTQEREDIVCELERMYSDVNTVNEGARIQMQGMMLEMASRRDGIEKTILALKAIEDVKIDCDLEEWEKP